MPIGSRTQPDAGRMPSRWNKSIAVWRLANNISPFLFRKADWHGLRTIWDSYKVESVKTLQTSDIAIERALDVLSLYPFDLVTFYNRRSVNSSHEELVGLRHTFFDLFSRDSIRIALAVRHGVQRAGPIQPASCQGESRELEITTDR